VERKKNTSESEYENVQRFWAIDTDRDIEVDYEQSVWTGNNVLWLDVEVGNTAAMQKCDTLYQLPAKIHNLAAKHSECESMI
jgi:protein gp37